MPQSISQKLKIREKDVLIVLNAPTDFKKALGEIPEGVKFIKSGKKYNQVHWFVMNKEEVDRELQKVLHLTGPGIICWVYFPKGSSGLQTDLTRDKGWENLYKEKDRLAWLNLISFNNIWSAFGFRGKTEKDKLKDAQPKEARPIFNWIDPVNKTMILPAELQSAFRKNKTEEKIFNSLPFSHKKEYLEWIITAKKAETKAKRIRQTIIRLKNGWKNPVNR